MEDAHARFQGSNPYTNEGDVPGPDSPRSRLPVPHRQVWAALQDGLRNLPRVRESVIWCGEGWKWSWQYSMGDIQLAFLLPSEAGVSAVLVVEDEALDGLLEREEVRGSIRELVRCTEGSGSVKRCWTPVLDVDTARDFLMSARALLEIKKDLRQ